MPEYESVVFDLDGTLVDSAHGIECALLESIRLILPEVVIDLPDIKAHIGPPLPELVRQLLPHVSPQIADQIEGRFRSIYDHTGWQQTTLYEGVTETLSQLSDRLIDCFLVTNKRLTPTRQILVKLGLLPFFREVVSADATYPTLQSKEAMVRYLIQKYFLDPRKTLVVGDTRSDATAAQTCGMDFALAVYGYGSFDSANQSQQMYTLHKLSELLHFVPGPI